MRQFAFAMRYVCALVVLFFCFLTEYFLAAKFLNVIHVSYWWMVYTILADVGNGFLFHRLIRLPVR